jgi:hypothetical protein
MMLLVASLVLLLGCGGEPTPGDPCEGIDCSDAGHCASEGSIVWCECEDGYEAFGLVCRQSDADADADGDVDEDNDVDTDVDVDIPTITGIDGTGAVTVIEPRPEDQAAWESHGGDRRVASRRVSSAEQVLVVSGTGLDSTTAARAEGEAGQGTITFEVLEPSEDGVRLRFPSGLGISTGEFMLTLETAHGDATALLYLLRGRDGAEGERGPEGEPGASVLDCEGATCTLSYDLAVEGQGTFGSVEATEGAFESLGVETLTVTWNVERPDCPAGYFRETACAHCADIVLCRRNVGGGRIDEIVKVGDFWVDRYEASVWGNADCTGTQYGGAEDNWATVGGSFPYHGSFSTPLYACSVRDVTPSRWLTWFQAQSACAAAGKRLLTNAEWQAAVAGTVDPGSNSADGPCLTGAVGPRITGRAGALPGGAGTCISYWGVEDMIGSLWEWTADWYGQGPNWGPDGRGPDQYFGDGHWNIDPAEWQGERAAHFLAAGLRGGDGNDYGAAGAFAVHLAYAPSASGGDVGFRCAMHSADASGRGR